MKTDYRTYAMNGWETLTWCILCLAGCMLVGTTFYGHWAAGAVLAILLPLTLRLRARSLAANRREILRLQFKDMLYFLAASMAAGKSCEAAFGDAENAMLGMYPDGRADILAEITFIRHGLAIHEPLDALLENLAERSGLEEAAGFADVLAICLRTGGNLVEVMQGTSRVIRDKVEIQAEIRTMVAAKRLEQRILSVTPVLMLIFVRTTSPEFMIPMFGTMAGRLVMTAALLLVAVGWAISERIMRIEV